MKSKVALSIALSGLTLCMAVLAAAKSGGRSSETNPATAPAAAANHAPQDDPARLEGERRFRSNCGRCHTAPPKFQPRMMATIIRHMRVRATITEDDMHFILHYMTQ